MYGGHHGNTSLGARPVTEAMPAKRTTSSGREFGVLLATVRQQGTVTRSALARDTRLSRPVVAQRVADLQKLGIIIAAGSEASSGGRPPRQVQFNTELGHLLVADISATSIDVAIADLSGAIRA